MKIFSFLLLVFAGCANCTSTQPTEPAPVIHPQPGKELCPQACEAMTNKLINVDGGVGCEEAIPAPAAPDAGDIACFDGGPANDCVSCLSFCVMAHENGSFWNTECISTSITKCEEIETVCNTQR